MLFPAGRPSPLPAPCGLLPSFLGLSDPCLDSAGFASAGFAACTGAADGFAVSAGFTVSDGFALSAGLMLSTGFAACTGAADGFAVSTGFALSAGFTFSAGFAAAGFAGATAWLLGCAGRAPCGLWRFSPSGFFLPFPPSLAFCA